MKFIYVKLVAHDSLAINVDSILYVRQTIGGACIGIKGGNEFFVRHCYDEIMISLHDLLPSCRVFDVGLHREGFLRELQEAALGAKRGDQP